MTCVLGVICRHGGHHVCTFAGIQRRRLDVANTFHPCHNPMGLCIRQISYARCLPVYYAQMARLATSQSAAHTHFLDGGFSVQRKSHNPFGKIPAEQAIDETINKDIQTPGSTKGFSLNPAATKRYYLTAEHRSTFLRQLRRLRDMETGSKFTHADFHITRIQKDHTDTESLIDILEHGWINQMSGD